MTSSTAPASCRVAPGQTAVQFVGARALSESFLVAGLPVEAAGQAEPQRQAQPVRFAMRGQGSRASTSASTWRPCALRAKTTPLLAAAAAAASPDLCRRPQPGQRPHPPPYTPRADRAQPTAGRGRSATSGSTSDRAQGILLKTGRASSYAARDSAWRPWAPIESAAMVSASGTSISSRGRDWTTALALASASAYRPDSYRALARDTGDDFVRLARDGENFMPGAQGDSAVAFGGGSGNWSAALDAPEPGRQWTAPQRRLGTLLGDRRIGASCTGQSHPGPAATGLPPPGSSPHPAPATAFRLIGNTNQPHTISWDTTNHAST